MLNINISVIMSVYNEKIEYFYNAVKSICNQNHKEGELIIINDGDKKIILHIKSV